MRKKNVFVRTLVFFLLMFLAFTGCSREGIPERSYTISGTVYYFAEVDDVQVTLGGAVNRITKTDKDGKYSFTGLSEGIYTVTPYLKGYIFNPEREQIEINDKDRGNVDFYGTIAPWPVGDYSISGRVMLSGNGGINGVAVKLSGDVTRTMTTDTNGGYNFMDVADGNYTVTPSLKNHAFTPVSRDVVVSGADAIEKDFTATLIPTSEYFQSDLTGTWTSFYISPEQWQRVVLSIENDGDASYEDYEDSQGNPNPNPGGLVLTIDADGATNVGITMASNKKLMAGTLGGLIIALKAGDNYDISDLNDTAFVYHFLKVGAVNEWRYGTGTIDNDGTMNIASETHSGGVPVTGDVGQITVDSDGVVTFDSSETFKGFLSEDKKTVVATETVDGSYVLWVIQIIGKAYTPGHLPNSVAMAHMLAGGENPAPLSVSWTATTFNSTMAASNWNTSNFPVPNPCEPSTDASGFVTVPGDANHGATHGQLADDGTFIVGTKTLSSDGSPFGYAMVVYTIK